MNLMLYSGGDNTVNEKLDLVFVEMVNNADASFAFIPAKSDREGKYYTRFKDYFSKYGFHNLTYFDVDEDFNPHGLDNLFSSDVIYLSGGNTFYFLHNLKRRGLMEQLYSYAHQDNKIVVGVSAGAMIMTPTVRTTAIYHQRKGDFDSLNAVGLTDFSGLGLVDFEFVPHFTQDTKGEYVREFVREATNPIYGCPDGSGIIVQNDKASLYGDVVKLN